MKTRRCNPGRCALLILLLGLATQAGAASVRLVNAAGEDEFSVELGTVLSLQLVVDAGTEQLTGYSFFVSYDPQVFALQSTGDPEDAQAFSPGDFLDGVVLVNDVRERETETVLAYTEAAAGGVARRAATGTGVAARFQLLVVRRPTGSISRIRVQSQGHDRASHYVTGESAGVELPFSQPLGMATAHITGFRILPLPDVTLIEGQPQTVFDLDAFVDSSAGQVVWSHSVLSEIPTTIETLTRLVTMAPRPGEVADWGKWAMIFRAFETGEGLTAADTVAIRVVSPPRISESFPDTIRFAEDTSYSALDLDSVVEDLDDLDAQLEWRAQQLPAVSASVDPHSHIVTLVPAPDYFGTSMMTFVVRDSVGLADTVSTVVEVAPVNDPPEALRTKPVYPVRGESGVRVPLAQLVRDRDDALRNLQFTLDTPAGVRAEVDGDELVITGEITGRQLLGFTVRDTSGATASGRQVAVVLDTGASVAPEISRLPALQLLGGTGGQLDLSPWVQDDQEAPLIWEAEADSGLSASVQNGLLVVRGEPGFVDTASVRLTVTDAQGNRDEAELLVVTRLSGDGLGPALYDPGKIGISPDSSAKTLDLDALVDDPDNSDAEITWQVTPSAGLVYDSETRRLARAPGQPLVRPASVTLRASDPSGSSDELTIPVLLPQTGEPPALRELPQVRLDSMEARVVLDLDEFAFDDVDLEAELVWRATAETGVLAAVDPVSHRLTLRRDPGGAQVPTYTQVLLQVTDTDGLSNSEILVVGLPPLFTLAPLPELRLVGGEVDSSLVLDAFVRSDQEEVALTWSVAPAQNLQVSIQALTHRLHVQALDPAFQGSETLVLRARDATGRSLRTMLRVVVTGRGLTPQLRDLPLVTVFVGRDSMVVDLDDYVVDDDPDSTLVWTVSGARGVQARIDSSSHMLFLDARHSAPGTETLQFLVRDPLGNSALQTMQVTVLQGGEPPVIGPLPQIVLGAGEGERRFDLAPYVEDEDTPAAALVWDVQAGPGMAARMEGSELVLAISNGSGGSRSVTLTVTDPQGNPAVAQLQIAVQEDSRAPIIGLLVDRHPVFSDVMNVRVHVDEPLLQAPTVLLDGEPLAVGGGDAEGDFHTEFSLAPPPGAQLLKLAVAATDRAGNLGRRELTVATAWMIAAGGRLAAPDSLLDIHVPDAAAGPGRLAMIYRMDGPQRPPGSGDDPVYRVALLRGGELSAPVTLNFVDPRVGDLGVLRWDAAASTWMELPTLVDPRNGWLAVSTNRLGVFRLGTVQPQSRRLLDALQCYPNPWAPAQTDAVRIIYGLDTAGAVRLQVYNSLGQLVRVLVDRPRAAGIWSSQWEGMDGHGRALGSGVYFLELCTSAGRFRGTVTVVR